MKDEDDDSHLTLKGWFWFCPIYMSEEDEPTVAARHPWLEWLFSVAEGFEATRIFFSSLFIPDYEPSFVFRITGYRDGRPLR